MPGTSRMRALAAAASLACVVGVGARSAEAQDRTPSITEVGAGSELESYLRLLQISGDAKWYPWSLRGLAAREIERMLPADSAKIPWKLSGAQLRQRFSISPVAITTTLNSSFPYGGNDGAVWAGRGLTGSITAGATARLGPLSLTIAPIAFATTNSSFPLLGNGGKGDLAFRDGSFPSMVDHPQRFGDGIFGRIDAGDSELRFDSRFVTAGIGNALMWWGPGVENGLVLSNNAAGIPHAFLGTGSPVNLWIGSLHGRMFWGKIAQSSYSPVEGSDRYVHGGQPGKDRLMAGMVMVFTPRPVPHLELGFTRFLHVFYPADGIPSGFWRKPWPVFLKKNLTAEEDSISGGENDLASLFARWTFPEAGFEIYAENAHDDWYHDLRDLLQEPEHNRIYMFGMQKVWRGGDRKLSVLRAEIVNYQMPPLGRDRPGQGFIYTHGTLRQGHTSRGQLLGSNAGVGTAAASVLAWDRYTPAGRTSWAWRRIVRGHRGEFDSTGVVEPKATDVIHALGAERTRLMGALRLTIGADVMVDLNRNFDSDVFNLSAKLGVQWLPGAGFRRQP